MPLCTGFRRYLTFMAPVRGCRDRTVDEGACWVVRPRGDVGVVSGVHVGCRCKTGCLRLVGGERYMNLSLSLSSNVALVETGGTTWRYEEIVFVLIVVCLLALSSDSSSVSLACPLCLFVFCRRLSFSFGIRNLITKVTVVFSYCRVLVDCRSGF